MDNKFACVSHDWPLIWCMPKTVADLSITSGIELHPRFVMSPATAKQHRSVSLLQVRESEM